jgi:uncharacterized membrane protein
MTISRAAPLHPVLVHFTIALVASSFGFDVLGRLAKVPSLVAAGWWTIAAAVPLTVATIITGLISRRRAPIAEGRAMRYLRLHTVLGPTFFGCMIAVALWRRTFWMTGAYPTLSYIIVSALLVGMMTVQGYLGGELVFAFGVEVKRRYKRLPIHET